MGKTGIQVSPLFKSSFYATSLLRKTYIVLIFANQKKSKEGFPLTKKGEKWKQHAALVLRSRCKGVGTWSRVALPRDCAQHLSTKRPRLWSVPRCILRYCVHPELPHGSVAKNAPAPQGAWVQSLGGEGPGGEKWPPIPVFWPGNSHGQEEPGGLQSAGSQRVGAWLSSETHTRCASARKSCAKATASPLTKASWESCIFRH